MTIKVISDALYTQLKSGTILEYTNNVTYSIIQHGFQRSANSNGFPLPPPPPASIAIIQNYSYTGALC